MKSVGDAMHYLSPSLTSELSVAAVATALMRTRTAVTAILLRTPMRTRTAVTAPMKGGAKGPGMVAATLTRWAGSSKTTLGASIPRMASFTRRRRETFTMLATAFLKSRTTAPTKAAKTCAQPPSTAISTTAYSIVVTVTISPTAKPLDRATSTIVQVGTTDAMNSAQKAQIVLRCGAALPENLMLMGSLLSIVMLQLT